ncbi:BEL1-like homeodomain protein 9 [Magnolia sinica]|uniref:BEL1-like homeodomain protein 9 n=1 Tax=Magnolia sinica TaxID=86752 RepID=UPI0026594915|nr:BEL1-like homeodomain protein 9 [Magnolia sinica]XP_058099445.1 BEL1-like homeodomain protein 9 [Magnolia sinica]
MSQGFELATFHVPQQSRRDKLRETAAAQAGGCAGLLPLYDPTLLSSPMLTCATPDTAPTLHPQPLVKEEGLNFMGFVGMGSGLLSSSTAAVAAASSSHIFLDPCAPEDISNPFFYTSQQTQAQSIRDFCQSYPAPQAALSYAPHDPAPSAQGLSLSLSSSSEYPNRSSDLPSTAAIFDQKGVGNCGPRVEMMSRSSVPLGPFTGYAAVLKGSRFLEPARQLLEEFCNVGQGVVDRSSGDSAMEDDREMESLGGAGISDGAAGISDDRRRKTRLFSMLDEAYRRYKQYYQQMQAVVASFESIVGVSTAAPYTFLALRAMSKQFRCLRNAITDQLRFTSKEESPRFGLVDQGLRHQKAAHNPSILDQPHVWRPQRGLPERAVAVLRAWLFEHFLHPYPTDTDKQMLAKQTGLTRNQVSNWFINARVRLWKPMVEEIHSLEMRQTQKNSEREDGNANKEGELPLAPPIPSDKQPQNTTSQKTQDLPPNRCRNELPPVPNYGDESMNFAFSNIVNHQQSIGLDAGIASGSGGVSLTLGLRQNNGVCLSEPMPVGIAHFSLEDNGNTYVMGGFEPQNRHFGRDIGGQLLRDFVG